jgi:predicted ATPase
MQETQEATGAEARETTQFPSMVVEPRSSAHVTVSDPLGLTPRLEGTDTVENFVIVSGCSGGGKSTVLGELRQRGFPTIEEPGRRIVAEELKRGGSALPWVDAIALARRAIEVSLADRAAAEASARWVFFDRGLIDAAAALEHLTGEPAVESLGLIHRYNKRVFLTPPWPEIYVLDQERRHGLAEAVAEYNRLIGVYPRLAYDVHLLPKVGPAERADWILAALAS